MGVNAMSMFAGTTSDSFEETRVLQLLNMVTAEELIDNDEYEGKPLYHIDNMHCCKYNLTDSFSSRNL